MEHFEPETSLLMNDCYQFYISYMYYKAGIHKDKSVFEFFFRKNPFEKGEYTIWCGLSKALAFIKQLRITDKEIEAVKPMIEHEDKEFYDWMKTLSWKDIKVTAISEGSVVYPREPLVSVEGPLGLVQLLETPLLVLFNYPCLVATQASRLRRLIPAGKGLAELGLRRAQGPNGGLTGSVYAYIGGSDTTSNIQATSLYGVPSVGTMAHSFVTSFESPSDLNEEMCRRESPKGPVDVRDIALRIRSELNFEGTHEGELASFIHYGLNYPRRFICLVDTWDTLKSGVPNYAVAYLAVCEFLGEEFRKETKRSYGVRLDSGNMAELSK
jgi:nicotinate phosphoribosyltransferase